MAGFEVFNKDDMTCFRVTVQPRASRNEVAGVLDDSLRVRLTSPALENRANRQLVNFLAEILELPRSRVSIVSGQRSRRKTIAVTGISAAVLYHRLAQYLV